LAGDSGCFRWTSIALCDRYAISGIGLQVLLCDIRQAKYGADAPIRDERTPRMRNGIVILAAVGLLATGGLAACDAEADAPRTPKIGVILPDSTTSKRWEQADRKYLKAAFDSAGIASDIQNAQGDKNRFRSIADQMISDGVTVLMIVNLDSISGKSVLDKAASKGVATIDYDRLTLNGGAQYYVSFDNRAVGTLQGEGLVKCLEEQVPRKLKPVIAELNGSTTDNNATLYKAGYDTVLEERYFANRYAKGPDQPVPDWDNKLAGTIFEQMLSQTKNRIDGVLAANDGLAGAVIAELRKLGMNGKTPRPPVCSTSSPATSA
jgi:D-xylose transport system substrate-binding protein